MGIETVPAAPAGQGLVCGRGLSNERRHALRDAFAEAYRAACELAGAVVELWAVGAFQVGNNALPRLFANRGVDELQEVFGGGTGIVVDGVSVQNCL